jgi:Xaa-Pro dipeptidase
VDYDWPHVDLGNLHKNRSRNFYEVLDRNDCDACILTRFDNIRYATNVRNLLAVESDDIYACVVSRRDESSYFFTPWKGLNSNPYADQPWVRESIGAPSWSPMIYQSDIWVGLIKKRLEQLGARRVGVEDLPFQIFEKLKAEMPGVSFKSIFSDLIDARAVKLFEEIRLLEQTASILCLGADAAFESINESMTEYQVMAKIFRNVYEQGAEFVSHNLCIHERTDIESYFPENRPVIRGDTFVFDIGCYGKGGYAGDMTRTVFFGRPPGGVKDAYKQFFDAYSKCLESIRPGALSSEINDLMNQLLRQSGFSELPYALGHGIGLRVIEQPHLDARGSSVNDVRLQEGMTVCIEPKAEVKSRGHTVTCRLEDVILVTDTGSRILTHSSYGDEYL